MVRKVRCFGDGGPSRIRLDEHPCMSGSMWDQMAADGNISELVDHPSLLEQYPLQCQIRARIMRRQKFTKPITS